jgi:hypothetical protein
MVRKALHIFRITLDCSAPGELTKSEKAPAACFSLSHESAVAFSTLTCNVLCPSPKSVLTPASSAAPKSGSVVSTVFATTLAMGIGCTHEDRGWETPSSASSAPPQRNDNEVSEKERSSKCALIAPLEDSEILKLGTDGLMPDVPLDESVEAMDASHFACSLTKFNLSSRSSPGNGGRLDKIWGVSAKLSGLP